jgi:sugar phosphate isomerase/epimerase
MISYCAWVFPQMNRHDLELLREAGYELIDVKPDTLADSGLHAAATELGMAVNCMSITFDDRDTLHSEDPRAVEAALDVVSRSCELGQSLGTSVAYVVPGQDDSQQALGRYRDALVRAADRAKAAGSRLCVEHFPGLSLPTAQGTLRFLDDIDHPNLYLLADLGHLQMSNEDPVSVIEGAGARLGYVHLDDNDGKGDLHLPLLQGVMQETDLDRTFAALRSAGYNGAVSLELSPKLENPHLALVEGFALVARLLNKTN